MRAVRRARQVLLCGCDHFTIRSNRPAALLAFGARAVVAAVTTATTAPPPATMPAVFAFAMFAAAATFAAGTAIAAIAAATLTATAALTATTAITAIVAATSSAAALTAVVVASTLAAALFTTRDGRVRLFAAEDALQPTEEAAGWFRSLGLWRALLMRLVGARLEAAFVTTWLAGLARFARITRIPSLARFERASALATFPRVGGASLPSFARFERASLASLPPIARLEGRPLVTAGRLLVTAGRLLTRAGVGVAGRGRRLPTHLRAPGVFRRQDVQFGLLLGLRGPRRCFG